MERSRSGCSFPSAFRGPAGPLPRPRSWRGGGGRRRAGGAAGGGGGRGGGRRIRAARGAPPKLRRRARVPARYRPAADAHRPLCARQRSAPDAGGGPAGHGAARLRSLFGRMIRTAWFYLVLVWSSVIHAGGVLIAALLGVKRRPGGIYDWGASDWARDLIAAAGTPVEVEGLERIPRNQPVVYASNHSSMFDIWALGATLPGSVRFVAKQELLKVPLVGRAMVAAGHVAIDRANPAPAFAAYERAAEVIRSGISAVVLPEGTLSRTRRPLPFKNAPFGLAIAAQVPLVPVYVHNTFEIP